MLDLKFIRQNKELIKQAIKDKQLSLDLNKLLELDSIVLGLKKKLQSLEEAKNLNAKQVPVAKKLNLNKEDLIIKGKKINKQIEELKSEVLSYEKELQALLYLVPNIPDKEAPRGSNEGDNIEIKKNGKIREFDFNPLDHVQLLEQNKWAELEHIAKISGSRSYALTNEMVLLELALLRFTLEKLQNKGFKLITVPALAREFAFIGTGHFPEAKEQVYKIDADNLYLTGTSEVVLNALHSDEILTEEELPILYAGFSPCFRREAGSYGKDTRGVIRVHQFYKVEQFVITKNEPEESDYWHKQLLTISEEVLQDLELPYRVVDICTGDMGVGKVRQFDLEAWLPTERRYRETHSCSALHDWQARRANLRYKAKDGKVKYCHTLNNTAIATPRIIALLLENHQNADSSINVPNKLQVFLGGIDKLGLK